MQVQWRAMANIMVLRLFKNRGYQFESARVRAVRRRRMEAPVELMAAMKTQGEIEAAVCEGIANFFAGIKVLSLHHDISTVSGEEVVLFTLAEPPPYRETRKTRSA